jgi:archaemetzincin
MKKLCLWLIISFSAWQIACEYQTTTHESNFSKQESNLAVNVPPSVETPENLAKSMKAVERFFQPMSKPMPNEWLATFKEDGQTFEEYINENPTLPTAERKTLYIQPIGRFDKTQLETIKLAAEYMQAFFNLPVKLLPEKTFAKTLPFKSYRTNKYTKNKQIRTGYVLEEILQPALPTDAAALIGFTDEDLYPNESFNYVFGQASFEKRVGIWSLSRLAENARGEQFLTRTLKIAVHETGHMFSIAHCTKYECVMSGTNHLTETDKRPIDACPECMAKICWMTGYQPEIRYENLANFCKSTGLKIEADKFVQKKITVGKS